MVNRALSPRQDLYLRIVRDHPGINTGNLWRRAHGSKEYGNHGVPANYPLDCLDRMVKRGLIRKEKPLGEGKRGRGSVTWYPV